VLVDASRIESWSFFEPFAGGGDPDYLLTGNRITFGMATATRHFEGYGAFQYSQLLNLPRNAVGLGPLGPGAFYYDAARAPNAYQLYFKALSLRARRLPGGVSFEVGRMAFQSNGEAASASADLERLKRDHLQGRLLGEVEWTPFERTFDGVRADVSRSRWHATAALLFPSQGAYEESANATISEVRLATGSLFLWGTPAARPDVGPMTRIAAKIEPLFVAATSSPAPAFEVQAFAQHYRDRRTSRNRPDNTGFAAQAVDIGVQTYGASLLTLSHAGRGQADALAWVAFQRGDWYGQPHRAWSAIAEGGYRWLAVPWRPWLRAGVTYASGDDDRADVTHHTFFPALPSSRPRLLAGTFAQMNLLDVFGEVSLQPRPRLGIDASLHRLSLANVNDRWYSGTGATALGGSFFGYTSRASGLETGLGTLLQVSAQSEISREWSLRGSLGVMSAGTVVQRLFAGDRLTVFAVESLLAF
jgi:hypothetical protein